MTNMASCRRTAAAVAVIAGLAGVAPLSSQAPDALVVRVYDSSPGNSKTRATAIRTAASIVTDANLVIDWTDCTQASLASACTDLRGPNDLIVRIMPLSTSKPPGLLIRNQQVPLGFSVVDPVVGAGAIAMVFLDRVVGLAHRTGVEPGRLLGRTIAHEVGHLILGTTEHSRSGLMREVWTEEEITRNRPEDWIFAESDRLRRQAR